MNGQKAPSKESRSLFFGCFPLTVSRTGRQKALVRIRTCLEIKAEQGLPEDSFSVFLLVISAFELRDVALS